MKKISLIVAMSENGIIGQDNHLPWHLPNDLKHFKALTIGKPIIMGRKTYESIGKPLPGRQNIIITKSLNLQIPGCNMAHSVSEALALTTNAPEVMVVGGDEIYRLFFPLVSCMHITYVHTVLKGDVSFLAYEPKEWQEIAKEHHQQDEKHAYDYSFVTLVRKR